jgi:hypothetical protein
MAGEPVVFRPESRRDAVWCREPMADPRALYVVMAVVLAGLAAWVLTVLVRADRLDEPENPHARTPLGKQDRPSEKT